MEGIKKTLKTIWAIIAYTFDIIRWLIVGTVKWFISAIPKTKKDISYAINLILANYFIVLHIFIPTVGAEVQRLYRATRPTVEIVEREVIVEKEVEPRDQVTAEKIIAICKKNGLTDDNDIKWILGKLWNESRWNQYAYNVNKNGTLDIGIAQWNMYYHPEVGMECALDMDCAISEMIKYRKDGKDIWWASDNL